MGMETWLKFYWTYVFRFQILQENHTPANRYSQLQSSTDDAMIWKETFFSHFLKLEIILDLPKKL